MARSRLCRVCDGWHSLAEPWPHNCMAHYGEPAPGALYVISDTMDGIRSMADGRMYDSKSRYRAELRAHGCYEVGNDRIETRPTSRPPVGPDLKRAYEQLSNR